MTMSIVETDRHSLPPTWVGRNGTVFVCTSTAGKGYMFALVYTLRTDGTRVPFDTVDLHAEDNPPDAFDQWRQARTGYAREAVAA